MKKKNQMKKKTVAKKEERNVFQIDVELIAYDKRSFSKTAGMLSGGTCSRTVKSGYWENPTIACITAYKMAGEKIYKTN